MRKSTLIKQFFARLGYKVRVNTGTGRGHWINAWIPCKKNCYKLEYDQPALPLDLRIECLKIIYPTNPNLWDGCAGNVRHYDISMHESEWDILLATYNPPKQASTMARIAAVIP